MGDPAVPAHREPTQKVPVGISMEQSAVSVMLGARSRGAQWSAPPVSQKTDR